MSKKLESLENGVLEETIEGFFIDFFFRVANDQPVANNDQIVAALKTLEEKSANRTERRGRKAEIAQKIREQIQGGQCNSISLTEVTILFRRPGDSEIQARKRGATFIDKLATKLEEANSPIQIKRESVYYFRHRS